MSLTRTFWGALAATLTLAVVLSRLDAGLRCAAAPLGIVSFELVGADGVEALFAGWSEPQRRAALFLQGLDYFFLVAYGAAMVTGALLLARRHARRPRLAALGRLAAWAAVAAALADAVENTPMALALLRGAASPAGASVSRISAIIKFGLLAPVLAYLLLALLTPRRATSPT